MASHSYRGLSYFPQHLSQQVKELFVSSVILNFAVACVALFEPVYLYTLGWSIQEILLFFLGVYVLYLAAMPLGANVARTRGYERAIFYSSFFLIGYYLSFILIPRSPFFIALAILLLAGQKMFYWPGYHADFARYGHENERGREISSLIVINSSVAIIGPLVGGTLIALGSFPSLFVFSSVLILISNLPLLATAEVFTPKEFSYRDAYRRLVRKDYRRYFYAFLGYGEEVVIMWVWPIFMFLIVVKQPFFLGLLVAGATLVSSLIVLYVGRASDERRKAHRRVVLRSGTAFYSLAGFLRAMVSGWVGAFLIDLMLTASKNILSIPLIAMTYDRASSTSVMKSVVHMEMSIVVGKIAAMLLSIGLLAVFSGSVIPLFILGGLITWFYAFAKDDYRPIT